LPYPIPAGFTGKGGQQTAVAAIVATHIPHPFFWVYDGFSKRFLKPNRR
jgi:hypothetical protein